MAGVLDARLSIGFTTHPKIKRLMRRLGRVAGFDLVCLILWTAANKPDGDLSGMTDEDIEIAAGWEGECGKFVATLADVRMLDGEQGAYRLHDWEEHQPWATGAEARSEKARWAGLIRTVGMPEATRRMPEYAARIAEKRKPQAEDDQLGDKPEPAKGQLPAKPEADKSQLLAGSGSAPLLSFPSPSPTPTLNTPLTPQGGQKRRRNQKEMTESFVLFEQHFWPQYPRKTGKQKAYSKWQELKVTPEMLPLILAGLEKWKRHENWTKDGGKYRHHPATWLHQKLWTDEEVCGSPAAAATAVPEWCIRAGFECVAEAGNRMCWEHTAHLFRDGKRIAQAEVHA